MSCMFGSRFGLKKTKFIKRMQQSEIFDRFSGTFEKKPNQ